MGRKNKAPGNAESSIGKLTGKFDPGPAGTCAVASLFAGLARERIDYPEGVWYKSLGRYADG